VLYHIIRGVIESKNHFMINGLPATLVVRLEGHHLSLILFGHQAPFGAGHLRLLNTLEANTTGFAADTVFGLVAGYFVACGAE
jgi:hypothetical protein